MNVKKNLPFVIGLACMGLLLLVALFFLWRASREFGGAHSSLRNRRDQLDNLVRQDPYPNPANVERAQRNLDMIRRATMDLVNQLRAGQQAAPPIESAEFPPLLERSAREMHRLAEEARVVLPPQFAFGFERYVRGELPDQRHVARLVTQLDAIRQICRLLFAVRINEIKRISRREFEAADRTPEETSPYGTDDPMMEPDYDMYMGEMGGSQTEAVEERKADFTFQPEWYDRERYELEFETRESGLWEFLLQVANAPQFIVLSRLEVTGLPPDRRGLDTRRSAGEGGFYPPGAPRQMTRPPPTLAGGTMPPGGRMLLHEERVIAGRDPILVKCTLDVYRFRRLAAGEEAQ
ncbi:MAG: Amuc_1100 family pilus-like protein [Candidatus Marinimicrobia bacterium]|nr:Amuc_1100 family pilus-like protein [Candidatus Neomarinimicrobiota bacterium]